MMMMRTTTLCDLHARIEFYREIGRSFPPRTQLYNRKTYHEMCVRVCVCGSVSCLTRVARRRGRNDMRFKSIRDGSDLERTSTLSGPT
jgi:hypothetical protein